MVINIELRKTTKKKGIVSSFFFKDIRDLKTKLKTVKSIHFLTNDYEIFSDEFDRLVEYFNHSVSPSCFTIEEDRIIWKVGDSNRKKFCYQDKKSDVNLIDNLSGKLRKYKCKDAYYDKINTTLYAIDDSGNKFEFVIKDRKLDSILINGTNIDHYHSLIKFATGIKKRLVPIISRDDFDIVKEEIEIDLT